MIVELLKEFDLENTNENIGLIELNLKVLDFNQRLYRLHVLYPDLYYIDAWNSSFKPLKLSAPSRSLETLIKKPRSELIGLKSVYMFVMTVQPSLIFNKKTADNVYWHLWGLRHLCNGEKEPSDLKDHLHMRGEDFWYTNHGVSIPLSSLLQDNPKTYSRIKTKMGFEHAF